MPFRFFRRAPKKEIPEKEEKIEVMLSPEDKYTKLEEDMQLLIDYFHEITRHLSKIEHKAVASEIEVTNISKNTLNLRRMVQKLAKNEPELLAYWNSLLNVTEDYVDNVKKILPLSAYELPLSQKRVEELGRISRKSTSEFVVLLNDVKKKLGKTYRKDFKCSWPQKSAFQ